MNRLRAKDQFSAFAANRGPDTDQLTQTKAVNVWNTCQIQHEVAR